MEVLYMELIMDEFIDIDMVWNKIEYVMNIVR